MKRDQLVSRHEVAVYTILRDRKGEWLTSREIASLAGVAERTARAHARHFVKLGLAEIAMVFPGHRYRFSESQEGRSSLHVQRLEKAAEVFGNKDTGKKTP